MAATTQGNLKIESLPSSKLGTIRYKICSDRDFLQFGLNVYFLFRNYCERNRPCSTQDEGQGGHGVADGYGTSRSVSTAGIRTRSQGRRAVEAPMGPEGTPAIAASVQKCPKASKCLKVYEK